MAVCKACNQDMMLAEGCKEKSVMTVDGQPFARIPYVGESERCSDCNVKQGQVHHRDCEVERCPRCDDHLIYCSCVSEEV